MATRVTGLLSNDDENKPPTAQSYGYEPVKAGSTGYDATTYAADERKVGDEGLMESRMTGLLKADSPYRQTLETQAKQEANRRGQLNTSLGVSGGLAAAVQGLLPIAQQDVNTIANQQLANQQYSNVAREYGATAKNQAAQFGADASNVAELSNAQAGTEAGRFGSSAANLAEQQRTAAEQQNWLANFNTKRQQETMQLEADIRERLAGVDQRYAVELETLKQEYNLLEKAGTQSGQVYSDTMKSISNILANADLTPEQQQAGVATQIQMLDSALAFLNGLEAAAPAEPTAPSSPSGLAGTAQPANYYTEQQQSIDAQYADLYKVYAPGISNELQFGRYPGGEAPIQMIDGAETTLPAQSVLDNTGSGVSLNTFMTGAAIPQSIVRVDYSTGIPTLFKTQAKEGSPGDRTEWIRPTPAIPETYWRPAGWSEKTGMENVQFATINGKTYMKVKNIQDPEKFYYVDVNDKLNG